MRAKTHCAALLAAVLAFGAVHVTSVTAQSKTEFDEVVDFSIDLKALARSIEVDRAEGVDRSKFLILSGTVSEIFPKESLFFLLTPEDLLQPREFLLRIKRAEDELSRRLVESMTEEARAVLDGIGPDTPLDREAVAAVLQGLNDVLRNEDLMTGDIRRTVGRRTSFREILAVRPEGEERVYLNRLVLDFVYQEELAPVQVYAQIVAGEWIGMDEVKSYKCLVRFIGPVSFRLFHRRRARDASSLMIPENTLVLAVVVPVSPVQLQEDTVVWMADALYLRPLK